MELKRDQLVYFWHPRRGGYYLGRIVRFHRTGKVRVRRLVKSEAFSLDPKHLYPAR